MRIFLFLLLLPPIYCRLVLDAPPLNVTVRQQPRGYTGDDCKADRDCTDPRKCKSANFNPCNNRGNCRCFPGFVNECRRHNECSVQEACAYLPGVPVGKPPYCTSRYVVNEYNLRQVCIDASVLRKKGIPTVYEKDQLAWVMCDHWNNCATPGHVVMVDTWVGSMQQWCLKSKFGCVDKVIKVNSPKGWGVRLNGNAGVKFTSLAARYETRLEVSVLRRLAGAGL